MNAPDKIFVGITDGKHYSIVGEGYPNAKEYISKEAAIRWFEQYKQDCKNIYFACIIREFVEDFLRSFINNNDQCRRLVQAD